MLRTRDLVLSLCCLAWAAAGAADAPQPSPGWRDAEKVQQMRKQAGLDAGKAAGPAGLRKAAATLQEALDFLERQDVREIGNGNPYLHFRGHDVRIDLASVQARLGMKDEALATLEAAQRFAWLPPQAAQLLQDEAFAGLRADPRFARILARAQLADRIWKGPASDVPYQDRLSVEQRIAGLTQFWSEARASFVYFDHVPELDWNRVYLDFLPKVMAAETTRDYYRVMMQLAPLLKDGHTNIYAPGQLADSFYARPPIVTALVENRVLVERVDSAALQARVRPGDEITAIDGVPVLRYAEERVTPFVSASTPQDRSMRSFSYQLLQGDAAAPIRLTLRDAQGTERQAEVARTGYTDVKRPERFAFRMLPGGVAYFALDHLENADAVKAFDKVFPEILKAKALVIDVRANGGGSSNFGWDVLSYLGVASVPAMPQYKRVDDPYARAQGAYTVMWAPAREFGGVPALRKRPQVFGGKVAVLTGAKTFSAAEDFVLAFKSVKRGVVVGGPTGGSTGQPLFMTLPGGGTARICIKRDLTPEGRDFIGEGIAPDLPASPGVDALRAGRDPVLERALAALRD